MDFEYSLQKVLVPPTLEELEKGQEIGRQKNEDEKQRVERSPSLLWEIFKQNRVKAGII
jgi:hypothetical protein